MNLRDQLEPTTFADDEPVGVVGVPTKDLPGPVAEDQWHYVPEPLWNRLICLGNAYNLHFAQLVEPAIDTVLNSVQCHSLCEELTFLRDVVADPAAHAAISTVVAQATVVARSSSMSLVISPP